MREKVGSIVLGAIESLNANMERKISLDNGLETRLYGEGSPIDSLSLVTLIVFVEEAIEEELQRQLTLADERAMSQTRSPFRTIGTFVDYILMLLEECNA